MTQQDSYRYVGEELDIFYHARRWKSYWSMRVLPWISGDVLEVGAGLGANTGHLQNSKVRSWHCLEPDPLLSERLIANIALLPNCSATIGTLDSLSGHQFDSILYVDVLEHIEDDAGELAKAEKLLRPSGHLIVLSPAHQFLFSPFDKAIGHFRRYNKNTLRRAGPPGCRLEVLDYLDTFGMMASLANRILLRQTTPTALQMVFWDSYIVPVSRTIDPLLNYKFGKSILAVWTRNPSR